MTADDVEKHVRTALYLMWRQLETTQPEQPPLQLFMTHLEGQIKLSMPKRHALVALAERDPQPPAQWLRDLVRSPMFKGRSVQASELFRHQMKREPTTAESMKVAAALRQLGVATRRAGGKRLFDL